jgi:[acyl-carrier-protein] S-malonyltransferase
LDLMVNQVANPVRWDLCMANLDSERSQLIELPPAGALAGLAKRGMPNSTAVAIKTPQDLEKLGS